MSELYKSILKQNFVTQNKKDNDEISSVNSDYDYTFEQSIYPNIINNNFYQLTFYNKIYNIFNNIYIFMLNILNTFNFFKKINFFNY
jgi:hypothetical protein